MTFGEKLRQLRKEFNYSQEQLAQKIGTAKSLIWKYEKDQAVPSGEVVKRIALVFNVSTDYLLFEASEKENLTRISDKKLLQQFEEIDKMDENVKDHIRFILEVTIHTYKIKQISA